MAAPDFTEITTTIPDSAEESLAEALSGRGILGVQLESREDGLVDVSVWVQTGDDVLVRDIRNELDQLGTGELRQSNRVAEDWSAEWRRRLSAFPVGRRWWIDPCTEDATPPPDRRLRLMIEPRAAFGSGTHESTQLALTELEDLGCHDLNVLDIGTGSGVLAVAAERLGAATVVALDIDAMAAWEARATAARQEWTCRPMVVAGPVDCLGLVSFDVVLCNMIHSEFAVFLGDLRRWMAPGGRVVLSGILECERATVEEMLRRSGLRRAGGSALKGWISVVAEAAEAG